jgi:hypothetical protein
VNLAFAHINLMTDVCPSCGELRLQALPRLHWSGRAADGERIGGVVERGECLACGARVTRRHGPAGEACWEPLEPRPRPRLM